ncbi:MAG: hypothetical protein K8F62_11215 [Pseudorhodoplanes sp.]|nr:hypothetical protein [Pseudorhodoplanes sp.]
MAPRAVTLFGFALGSILFAMAGNTANAQQRPRVIVRPLLYPPNTAEETKRYLDEKVVTRVGIRWNQEGRAVDFAALYRPYAQMASLAYVDPKYSTPKLCPDADALSKTVGSDSLSGERVRLIRRLQHDKWNCVRGYVGPLACPKAQPNCHPVRGLQLHVWVNKNNDCAIVFRGTDFTDIGDWISNFRWFNRLLPIADQYDQVGENIKGIIRKHCPGRGARVVTVGHSLGGGLAQFGAFKAPRVGYAYTFDPSPVTGFDVPRHDPVPGRKLGIDRVHEAGEILATPRYLIGGFIPARNCRPYTRYVRFNTILTGFGVFQHSMGAFTHQLERRAQLGNAAKTIGKETEKNCEIDPDRGLN